MHSKQFSQTKHRTPASHNEDSTAQITSTYFNILASSFKSTAHLDDNILHSTQLLQLHLTQKGSH